MRLAAPPLLVAACTAAPTAPSSGGDAAPTGWQRCTNEPVGYSISYPGDWFTTDIVLGEHQPTMACTYFSSHPFDVVDDAGTAFVGVETVTPGGAPMGAIPNDEGLTFAIHLYVQDLEGAPTLDALIASHVGRDADLLSSRDLEVAGYEAVVIETLRTVPDLGAPRGRYAYLFVRPGEGEIVVGVVAEHTDAAADFDGNVAVLMQMMETLDVT